MYGNFFKCIKTTPQGAFSNLAGYLGRGFSGLDFKLLSTFENVDDWSNATEDTVNYTHGSKSVKLIGTNVETWNDNIENFDASGKLIYLRFYIPEIVPNTYIRIGLYNDWAYVVKRYLVRETREGSKWIEYMFNVDSCEKQNGMDDIRIKDINRIRIHVTSSEPVEVTLDALALVENPQPEAKFTITFDDGNKSDVSVAAPIMSRYGFRGVSYVIPTKIGNSGALSMSDLRKLQGLGWDICSHGYEDKHLTEITGEELRAEIRQSKEWLIENGFGEGALHYCAPSGLISDEAIQELKNHGFLTLRTDLHADTTTKYQVETLPPANPYRIMAVGMFADAPSLTEIEALIDNAIQSKSWVVFMFHGVGSGSVPMPVERFAAIMEMLYSKKAKVVTMSDLTVPKF